MLFKIFSVVSLIFSISAIFISASNDSNKVAYFNPSQEEYQIVKMDSFGDILILISKIEKHEAGYKVHFKIGNPYSITLIGNSFKLEWGENFEHEKIVNIKQDLLPARWNDVDTVITPASELQIKKFAISEFKSNGVTIRD